MAQPLTNQDIEVLTRVVVCEALRRKTAEVSKGEIKGEIKEEIKDQ